MQVGKNLSSTEKASEVASSTVAMSMLGLSSMEMTPVVTLFEAALQES